MAPAQPGREAVFRSVYRDHAWKGRSRSGPGSDAAASQPFRAFLEDLIRRHRVGSVLDVGCGDWTSTRLVDWGGVDYMGIDIVPEVIEANRRRYGRAGVRFDAVDFVHADFPPPTCCSARRCSSTCRTPTWRHCSVGSAPTGWRSSSTTSQATSGRGGGRRGAGNRSARPTRTSRPGVAPTRPARAAILAGRPRRPYVRRPAPRTPLDQAGAPLDNPDRRTRRDRRDRRRRPQRRRAPPSHDGGGRSRPAMTARHRAPWEWAVAVGALFALGRANLLFVRQRTAEAIGGPVASHLAGRRPVDHARSCPSNSQCCWSPCADAPRPSLRRHPALIPLLAVLGLAWLSVAWSVEPG